jgi:hypothetical protein
VALLARRPYVSLDVGGDSAAPLLCLYPAIFSWAQNIARCSLPAYGRLRWMFAVTVATGRFIADWTTGELFVG